MMSDSSRDNSSGSLALYARMHWTCGQSEHAKTTQVKTRKDETIAVLYLFGQQGWGTRLQILRIVQKTVVLYLLISNAIYVAQCMQDVGQKNNM